MTCDLKMSLAVAAEKSIRPLADLAKKRARELETLRKRLEGERGSVENLETHLAELKAAASEYLTDNAFASFKVKVKRVTADLATTKEAVTMFERDLIPAGQRDLADAREKLGQAFTAACAAARADCEASMAEKLGAIVAEHDAFMAAIAELGKTYGTSSRGEPPKIAHVRLGEVRHTTTGRRWVTFLRAPAVAAPAATSPAAAVLAQPGRVESAPTGEVGPEVKEPAPLPPEAATEALGAAASRARVLLRPRPLAETPPEPTQDGSGATPTDDLDAEATDKQTLDAAPADLDAGQGEADDDLAGVSPTPGE